MNKEQQVALKTMGIKARVANFIRKSLFGKRLNRITDKEKIELFDLIYKLNNDMHTELNMYKDNRKHKATIEAARIERGYYEKKAAKKALRAQLKKQA